MIFFSKNSCSGTQWHLLSLLTADNWHRNCPSDCSDPLAQLPYDITFHILSFLDPSWFLCIFLKRLLNF